jgi:hypothetical protein
MSLFTHIRPVEFNRNDVVVCHELAHTVVWYSFGREIRGITFRRSIDGYLSGGSANVNPSNLENTRDAEQFAERMLAGDSAARRKLVMRRDQISTVGFAVNARTSIPALLGTANRNDDAMWAIFAAYKTKKPNWLETILIRLGKKPGWYKWLSLRLEKTNARVDAHWRAIEVISEEVIAWLPANGEETVIPTDFLIGSLEREGVQQCG